MTTVYMQNGKRTFTLSVRGHCSHDVCVSISALAQALLQYTQDFMENNAGFRVEAMEYGYGHTLLSVFCEDGALMEHYKDGTRAVVTGLELYAHSFAEDVVLVCA